MASLLGMKGAPGGLSLKVDQRQSLMMSCISLEKRPMSEVA